MHLKVLVVSPRDGFQHSLGMVPKEYVSLDLMRFFKDIYGNAMGKDNLENSKALRMFMWAIASGSAEVFADVALCPFEMTKVKMQVSLPGEKGGISPSLIGALRDMRSRPETGFPFGSLGPLWGRQIPYTMIKFVGFYLTAETVYDTIESRYGYKKSESLSVCRIRSSLSMQTIQPFHY